MNPTPHDGLEPLFPLFLRLTGRPVLVVGAGKLGSEKVRELLAAGAVVRVVAPHVSEEVRALAAEGRVSLEVRPFADLDLADRPFLIIAATGDAAVHARIYELAEAQRTFAVALDAPAHGNAFFGSVLKRAPFLVAISSHGQMPALTRLLREVLEHVLPPEHVVERARELRRQWKAEATPMGSRFEALVTDLVRSRER